MIVESVGGRKVLVTLIMAGVGLALTFYKGDIPPGLLGLMQTIFGAFVVGNVFEHIADASVKRKQATQVQAETKDYQQDFVYLSSKLEALEASSAQNSSALASLQKAVTVIIDKAGFNR